jgi:hypothetical protein
MNGPLCSDEVFDLQKLGELLQHPEKYGVTIDRGTNPEAGQIIDAGAVILLALWERRRNL